MSFGSDRQMFAVDVNCATCGAHISQLPFQPSGDRPVYCSDCNRARRADAPRGGASGGFVRRERQMFDVNLTCADCGSAITQLPFQPSGDKPVYCRTCLQNRRGA